MRVLIVGAGASRGAQNLPTATDALAEWEPIIRDHYPLLTFALRKWVGHDWPHQDLETAWTTIDLAWKERTATTGSPATAELALSERHEVWQLALAAAAAEPAAPTYYRTQIAWARSGYSTEQFLSVAAGWELRRLVQEALRPRIADNARVLYQTLLHRCEPAAIISFNYDTLIEQCLPPGTWHYAEGGSPAGRLPIFKPHGSVNWTHQYAPGAIPADAIDLDRELAPEEMGYEDGRLKQNLIIGLRSKIEHTTLEPSPVILTLFVDVLSSCEDVLARADNVWVVGYRFASADTTFLDLVARAIARRNNPVQLAVVDRGHPGRLLPLVKLLFALPSGQPVEHCFHGFADWCDHNFCGY